MTVLTACRGRSVEVPVTAKCRCILIGHKWRSASIGPRTVAAIECARCGTLRFGGPFR